MPSKFKTPYDGNSMRTACSSGSPIVEEYATRLNKNGVKELYVKGTSNIQEKIQAQYEDTRIENIILKFVNGDMTVLNKRQGVYTDITEMPENIHEVQIMMENARNEWYNLPAEIKADFNNDIQQFTAASNEQVMNSINKLTSRRVGEINESQHSEQVRNATPSEHTEK